MIKPYSYYDEDLYEKFNKLGSLNTNNGFGGFADTLVYADDESHLYLVITDEECGDNLAYYSFDIQDFVIDENIEEKLHPATRKEIKAAGLWDYVINKEDYSSEEDKIETELDEYLRIGEELSKAKNSEEK